MATLTQLKDARNAGLNLAKATQDFAQVDILSANKDAPVVVAAVKVAADAAIAAAAAVAALAAWLAFASARACAADVACVIFVATWDKFVVKFTRFEPL